MRAGSGQGDAVVLLSASTPAVPLSTQPLDSHPGSRSNCPLAACPPAAAGVCGRGAAQPGGHCQQAQHGRRPRRGARLLRGPPRVPGGGGAGGPASAWCAQAGRGWLACPLRACRSPDTLATSPVPHPTFPLRRPPAAQCGVGHLARVLNTLLVEHIRGLLPSLRNKARAHARACCRWPRACAPFHLRTLAAWQLGNPALSSPRPPCLPPACFRMPQIEDAAAARRRELSMYGEAPPGTSKAQLGGLLLTILDSYASRFRCGGARQGRAPGGEQRERSCSARAACLPRVGGPRGHLCRL